MKVFEWKYISYRLEVGYKVIVEPYAKGIGNQTFTEIAEETNELLKNSTFENYTLTWTNVTESRMESGKILHIIPLKNTPKKLRKTKSKYLLPVTKLILELPS